MTIKTTKIMNNNTIENNYLMKWVYLKREDQPKLHLLDKLKEGVLEHKVVVVICLVVIDNKEVRSIMWLLRRDRGL
jgi:hypothetical protein